MNAPHLLSRLYESRRALDAQAAASRRRARGLLATFMPAVAFAGHTVTLQQGASMLSFFGKFGKGFGTIAGIVTTIVGVATHPDSVVQAVQNIATHGVYVTDRVRGGYRTKRVGVVHNGREEVYCLHDGAVFV